MKNIGQKADPGLFTQLVYNEPVHSGWVWRHFG